MKFKSERFSRMDNYITITVAEIHFSITDGTLFLKTITFTQSFKTLTDNTVTF